MTPRGWRGWVKRAIPDATGFESTRQITKWLALGTAIGCVAGLGAIVFYGALAFATRALLGADAAIAVAARCARGWSP